MRSSVWYLPLQSVIGQTQIWLVVYQEFQKLGGTVSEMPFISWVAGGHSHSFSQYFFFKNNFFNFYIFIFLIYLYLFIKTDTCRHFISVEWCITKFDSKERFANH
jgi:hypothetical protein